MSYRFILPTDVENQVYDCALHIAQDNPTRAISWLDEVIEAMKGVCEMPHAHTEHPALSRQVGRTIRHRPFGNYLIFYQVDDEAKAVIMHLFIHAKRDRENDD